MWGKTLPHLSLKGEINLELNKVYNMDCLKGMGMIPDNSIDLIVTDPPYLMRYKSNYRKGCKEIAGDNNPELIRKYIAECYRILKPDKAMYIFCNSNKVDFFKQELEKYFAIKNMIIWVKNNWSAGDLKAQFGKQYELIFLVNKGRCPFRGKRITDVWYFDRVPYSKQLHQNQKPVELIARCIDKHSDTGDIVFDGFMGAFTTAIVCIEMGRKFIGFEISEKIYAAGDKRLLDYQLAYTE